MAKALYKEWLKPQALQRLEGWKRNGLTDEQIANNIGIRRETLWDWQRKYPNIANALKRGKEDVNFAVENALLRKALSGNTTAMIFFLKNNWRDKYNDSQLSKEERELVLANIRKANADARIKKAKAIVAERLGTEDNEQLDQVLNKLIEEAGKDGTNKSINEETD
ncbi:DNA-packaging protein [Lactobacillus gasseri CECT 5714]|uniref:DNA-packaging protein n=1 Tax=Lactobacillus gasseri TaxID=1596 RepID=UPI001C4823F6|nr:DNA-packaging protein [Lactobacillus gasseri]MBV6739920.1 DNA-packaging protein [Lactobacillus gasseri CECT 5714]